MDHYGKNLEAAINWICIGMPTGMGVYYASPKTIVFCVNSVMMHKHHSDIFQPIPAIPSAAKSGSSPASMIDGVNGHNDTNGIHSLKVPVVPPEKVIFSKHHVSYYIDSILYLQIDFESQVMLAQSVWYRDIDALKLFCNRGFVNMLDMNGIRYSHV